MWKSTTPTQGLTLGFPKNKHKHDIANTSSPLSRSPKCSRAYPTYLGQVALQLQLLKSDHLDFCTATLSNTQAALGARFRAPLPGDFGAVKGSVKLRLKHGSRRPDLQFSAMPTDKKVMAAGAVGLLAGGKGVSYSPDVKLLGGPPRRLRGLELRPRVGVDLDLKARWDQKLRGLAVELRDCNLVIKA